MKRSKRTTRYSLAWNRSKCFLLIFILIDVVMTTTGCEHIFGNTHYKQGTIIQGVDCSRLTPEEARTKIEEEIRKKEVSIQLQEEDYSVSYETLDFEVTTTEELEEILTIEYNNNDSEQTLTNSVTISAEKLREWLQSVPSLQESNMQIPQNAYIQWDGTNFSIVPEVLGNWYDFEEIYQILLNDLSSGMPETINLQQIAYVYPEITTEQLKPELDRLESILSTTIHYQLTDGTIYSLNRDVMKQWVVQDENGNYQIEVDTNVHAFVEQLNELAQKCDNELTFSATEIGQITVPIVDKPSDSSIYKEKEIARILNMLGSGETYQYTPICNTTSLNVLVNYIELDITRQHLWMYIDGECIVSTDCVTGNISQGYRTPTGVYYLDSKTTNAVLRGYNRDGSRYASWVQYWMPFYGAYGLHDATWRDSFGGDIYKTNGSHGCVNLPYEMAETIYVNINYEIPIIIYES